MNMRYQPPRDSEKRQVCQLALCHRPHRTRTEPGICHSAVERVAVQKRETGPHSLSRFDSSSPTDSARMTATSSFRRARVSEMLACEVGPWQDHFHGNEYSTLMVKTGALRARSRG